jgi:hypothetical protein
MIQNRTLANNTLDYEIDYERGDGRNVHEG